MATVTDLIRQWHAKEIQGTPLMRGLVNHDHWDLRLVEEATGEKTLRISTTKDGKRCLLLFSDGESYSTFAKANNVTVEQHFLTVPGAVLFAGPMEDIDQIWVDPLTSHDIFYDCEVFPRLREMANAVVVEGALAALRGGDAPEGTCRRVREYKNYYLASVVRDGGPSFLMAPDNKGRTLAAAFTADDTFDAFLPEAREMAGGADVQQLQIDGDALFDTFQRMKIDGFVFNCSGPVVPVAFAQAAAGFVLAG